MFLLAFHIVSIGILAAIVWAAAYAQGKRVGERRLRRQLNLPVEEGAPAPSPQKGFAK